MCGNASVWAKLAFPVILLSLVLDIVGFATTSWMVNNTDAADAQVGLWQQKVCVGDSCVEGEVSESLKDGLYNAIFNKGEYPQSWGEGIIIPIFKGGSVEPKNYTDTFTATQVFAIITFILILFATGAIGAYVFMNAVRTSALAMVAMILCFAACVSAFVCMICWVVFLPDPYIVSYSLGLTVIAGILALIAGLLLVPDVLEARSYPGNRARVDSPPNRRFMFK